MSSPNASSDSETEMGMKYYATELKLKTKSGKTRIQVQYDDGDKEIINDPCDSKFGSLLVSNGGTPLERNQARQSLKRFSGFLLDQSVEVSHGYKCWNLLCSGRDCGIKASCGMPFIPPENLETHGNIASHPEEQGYYKVHLTTPISSRGRVTNLIKLRKERVYLIAGRLGETTPYNHVSSRPRRGCECEQCIEDGISREFEEAIINPLEILSLRYQSSKVSGMAIWRPMERALVRKDEDGTHRIMRYASPEIYSEFICDRCKLNGKVMRCGKDCLEFVSRKDGPDLDIVEPSNAAVLGTVFEFCPRKYRKLRKALRQVTGRLESLGLKQGGPVLSDIARLVRATRAEVVFVLNNDESLVQPIISGNNCFLRRDVRGQWNSRETLTGCELNKQIFWVDPTGAWIMIGTGDKYGVSSTNTGNYHLDLEGQSMIYGPHLDTQEFGGTSYIESEECLSANVSKLGTAVTFANAYSW